MYADKTQYTGQLVIGTVEVGYTQFIFQDTIRILLYTIQDTISELKNIFAEAILYRNKLHSYTVAQLHTHKPKKID